MSNSPDLWPVAHITFLFLFLLIAMDHAFNNLNPLYHYTMEFSSNSFLPPNQNHDQSGKPATTHSTPFTVRMHQSHIDLGSPSASTSTDPTLRWSIQATVAAQCYRTLTQTNVPTSQVQQDGWWFRLQQILPSLCTIVLMWNEQPCPHCNALLLKEEDKNWCCRGGKLRLDPLPPLPLYLEHYVRGHPSIASNFSRKVNNLFAFSSLGVEGRFEPVPAPSNVVITGRVYHQLCNIDQGQHSLRWFSVLSTVSPKPDWI